MNLISSLLLVLGLKLILNACINITTIQRKGDNCDGTGSGMGFAVTLTQYSEWTFHSQSK